MALALQDASDLLDFAVARDITHLLALSMATWIVSQDPTYSGDMGLPRNGIAGL